MIPILTFTFGVAVGVVSTIALIHFINWIEDLLESSEPEQPNGNL